MAIAVNDDQRPSLCAQANAYESLLVGIGLIVGDRNRVIVFEYGNGLGLQAACSLLSPSPRPIQSSRFYYRYILYIRQGEVYFSTACAQTVTHRATVRPSGSTSLQDACHRCHSARRCARRRALPRRPDRPRPHTADSHPSQWRPWQRPSLRCAPSFGNSRQRRRDDAARARQEVVEPGPAPGGPNCC